MNLVAELDPQITRMAQALLQAPKPAAWRSASVRTRITPDGSTGTQSFELLDAAGAVVAGWFPPDDDLDQLYALARECWQAARKHTEAPWYGMNVVVSADGRFAADFEYRETYHEGDIMRPE